MLRIGSKCSDGEYRHRQGSGLRCARCSDSLIKISRARGIGMPDHQDFLRGRRLVRLFSSPVPSPATSVGDDRVGQLAETHGKHLRRLDLGFNP